MKNFLRVPSFVLLAGLTLASLPQVSRAAVDEILMLPPANRVSILKNASSQVYAQIRDVAFSEQQPMSMRWKAVTGLAEARKEKSVPDLILAAQNKEWFMRNAALVALNHVHPQQAQRLARQLLQDKALVVRSAAVDVLQGQLTQENRDLLWEQLDNPVNFRKKQSLWIRPQIVEALAVEPKAHERLFFSRLLNESDVKMQEAAIRGLENVTGVKLGRGRMQRTQLVALWKKEMNQ